MAHWLIYSDGASRGNPGPAGFGAWVRNEDTGEVAELSGHLGIATNNVAEYHGLLAGLRYVLDHGGGAVRIRADSELLIRQLQGQYQVKHPNLVPLFREALAMLARLDRWTAEHVPRALNRDADRLANRGIDEASPPSR
jgi:ribonuclease HI